MRGILGFTGASFRAVWQGRLVLLLLIYAAFLGSVLIFYPAVDDEAHFRQALSFGHGALQIGVGLVCLLLGVTAVAFDHDGGRTARWTTTPLGRAGFVAGKAGAIAIVAMILAVAMGAVEATFLRVSFWEHPELFKARPIVREESFRISPESVSPEGPIEMLEADRIAWGFPDVRADLLVLDLKIEGTAAGAVLLRVRAPESGLSQTIPWDGAGRLDVPLPDWAKERRGEGIWIEVLHVSREEVPLSGNIENACWLIGPDFKAIDPVRRHGFGRVRDENGKTSFRPRRGIWTFRSGAARRADRVLLKPIIYTRSDLGAAAALTFRRSGYHETMERLLEDGREITVPIPDRIRSLRGDLEVEIVSLDPKAIIAFDLGEMSDGAPSSGLFLSGPAGALETNLLLGAIAAGLQGMLLGAAGIAASLLFSSPVALFTGIAFYILGVGAGLFHDLPEMTSRTDPVAEVFGIDTSPSPTLIWLAARASRLVPDFGRFDMKPPIMASNQIPPSRVFQLLIYSGFISSVFLAGAWLLFRRRDIP